MDTSERGFRVLLELIATMRATQLPLSQTQKVRLQRALDHLDSLSDASVTVADPISVNYEDGVLK